MKKKGVSYKVFGLQALERRLMQESQRNTAIKEELRIAQAGVNGESRLISIFEKYTFPFEHYVFHDLNLQSSGKFQIDTLFLTSRGAFVLEVKNIAGKIYFPKDRKQMERTLENGQVDVFECPSVQLERNMSLLGDWLHARQIAMPIQGAVVFGSPRQKFENDRENLRILFPLEVPGYLRSLHEISTPLKSVNVLEIASDLVASHREYNPFPICARYGINPELIQTGVLCERCGIAGMIRISKGWACKRCEYFCRQAHEQAILDRFMLLGGTLTNHECREFLQTTNASMVKRLLGRMEISSKGVNKGRVYWMELTDMDRKLVGQK
ncbi:nuclease-related domain-containing protein [Sporosarcina sp. CAU 1771]